MRTIKVGRSKEQTPKFRVSTPLSGPAYSEKLSDDAPVLYSVSFTFGANEDEAIRFLTWVKNNKIDEGQPFDLPMTTEGTFVSDEAAKTQEVRAMPSPEITSNTHSGLGTFAYQATLQCRKEVTGLEDFYDLIEEGGAYLLNGRAALDVAVNLTSPEA